MAGTQIVKTELLINAALYYAAHEPAAVLLVQPTQSAAENFSKERFAPSVEASPALRDLFTPGAHDSDNTITAKSYPGGSLHFVGANSPTDPASRPKRIILTPQRPHAIAAVSGKGSPAPSRSQRILAQVRTWASEQWGHFTNSLR